MSKQASRSNPPPKTMQQTIEDFHLKISKGPIYICCICDQFLYRHSVLLKPEPPKNHPIAIALLLEYTKESFDGKVYVCKTCNEYLKKNKTPPCAIDNGLKFPDIPEPLKDLHEMEFRLLSPRLAFMKIHSAPSGGQKKIRGNIVNVPADVSTTVTTLPRLQDSNETIQVKLKRRLKYEHAVLSQAIRPAKVIKAAEYITKNSTLIKEQGICYDPSWSYVQNQTHSPIPGSSNNINQAIETSQESSNNDDNDEDKWSEPDENDYQEVSPGCSDTFLTTPSFVDENERNQVYSYAPGQNSSPISILKDKHCEELAFPAIFMGEKRPSNFIPLHYSQIVKSELRRTDRRVAKNPENIFFKTKKLQLKQLTDKINISMRTFRADDTHMKAGTFKDKEKTEDFIAKDKGFRFMRTLRGSPPYFQSMFKDLLAMIRQLGPATFFITLSAAETRWSHLLKILSLTVDNKELTDDDVQNLNWHDKCRLISSDPVTCTRHFDYMIQEFFNFLKCDSNPLGQLEDYFSRIEFQTRLSAHMHGKLWILNAPKYGTNTNEEVVEFIDKYITCHIPTPEEDQELHDLVTTLQLHRHSRSCKKLVHKKCQEKHDHDHSCIKQPEIKCRFHYPRPPMDMTCILEPLESDDKKFVKECKKNWERVHKKLLDIDEQVLGFSLDEAMSFEDFLKSFEPPLTKRQYLEAIQSSIKQPTYFLKRTTAEIRTNQYNVSVLKAWRANMDLQFIMNAYACASYCTSYISKSQRGMSEVLRNAVKEAQGMGSNVRDQLRRVMNRFLNAVEIGAPEAIYLTLQLPLRRSSRAVEFIPTQQFENRNHVLKSQDIIDELDDNDRNIRSNDLIDKYVDRPDELENITLVEFVCFYTKDKKTSYRKGKRGQDGFLPEENDDNDLNDDIPVENETKSKTSKDTYYRRKIPRVMRSCHYNKISAPEDYYREKIMLYTNWRNEDKLKGESATYKEQYRKLRKTIVKIEGFYQPYSKEVDEAEERIDEEQSNQSEEYHEVTNKNLDNAMDKGIENSDIGPDIGLDAAKQQSYCIEAPKPVSNEDFLKSMRKLNSRQRDFFYTVLNHAKTSNEPMYYFLTGGAGVGKTFLAKQCLHAILKYMTKLPGVNSDEICIITAAPTGKAAYVMSGSTIHSVFAVPFNANLSEEYKELTAGKRNTMYAIMKNVKYIFLDEISMVGGDLFEFIHNRLVDIFKTPRDMPFAGRSVLAWGDFYQFSPVFDRWIFQIAKKGLKALGPNLWQDNFKYFELTDIMRQSDTKFAEVLNRIRKGNQTEEDVKYINQRNVTDEQEKSLRTDIPHFFHSNASVDEFNEARFEERTSEKKVVIAKDTLVSHASSSREEDSILSRVSSNPRKTGSLYSNLKLATGLPYDISINMRSEDGLTNGAPGIVKLYNIPHPQYASGVVWIEFEHANIGKLTRLENTNLYRNNSLVKKEWTPIQPLNATFKVGKNNEVNRTQFPLRPCSARTFHRAQGDTMNTILCNFTGKNIPAAMVYVGLSRCKSYETLYVQNFSKEKIKVDKNVTNEMARLANCPVPIIPKVDPEKGLYLVFLNAQSLRLHLEDIIVDERFTNAHVLSFCETRFDKNTDYEIPGFTGDIVRKDGECVNNKRSYYGLAIYSKLTLDRLHCTDDIIVVNVTHKKIKDSIKLAILYKKQDMTEKDFLTKLEPILIKHLNGQPSVILGDFNIEHNSALLRRFFHQYGFRQVIQGPTTDFGTTIDLCFTNITNYTSGVLETYFSYHKGIWLQLPYNIPLHWTA